MQKTEKQIVNHLLALFLHAQKAGDATRAKRDGDIPVQSRWNYNYFTAKARRKKQSASAIKFSEFRVRTVVHLISYHYYYYFMRKIWICYSLFIICQIFDHLQF